MVCRITFRLDSYEFEPRHFKDLSTTQHPRTMGTEVLLVRLIVSVLSWVSRGNLMKFELPELKYKYTVAIKCLAEHKSISYMVTWRTGWINLPIYLLDIWRKLPGFYTVLRIAMSQNNQRILELTPLSLPAIIIYS